MAKADWIKDRTAELVRFVKAQTEASGPETKRAAAIAVTGLEQAGMWAERAFGCSDFVPGDDGGAAGEDRSARDPSVSPNDEGLDGIDRGAA